MDVSEWFTSVAGATGAAGALVAAAVTTRRRWRARVSPFIESVSKGLLVLNGRDAITLPEDPSVILAEPILGALDRLSTIEAEQAKIILHLGHTQMGLGRMSEKVDGLTESNEYQIAKIHDIEHEVKPNGGSSIKDSVDRIETATKTQAGRLIRIETALVDHAEVQDRIETKMDDATDHLARIDTRLQEGDVRMGDIEETIRGHHPDQRTE